MQPEESVFGNMRDIVSHECVDDKLYITPVACFGILRRGGKSINPRLKKVLEKISSEMSVEEIEEKSRRQPRGAESGMAKLTRRMKDIQE